MGTIRLGRSFLRVYESASKNSTSTMNMQVKVGKKFTEGRSRALFRSVYLAEAQLIQRQLGGNLAGVFFIVGLALG